MGQQNQIQPRKPCVYRPCMTCPWVTQSQSISQILHGCAVSRKDRPGHSSPGQPTSQNIMWSHYASCGVRQLDIVLRALHALRHRSDVALFRSAQLTGTGTSKDETWKRYAAPQVQRVQHVHSHTAPKYPKSMQDYGMTSADALSHISTASNNTAIVQQAASASMYAPLASCKSISSRSVHQS